MNEFYEELDSCIAEKRPHATLIPWVKNSRDSLALAHKELIARGWVYRSDLKQFERDGWSVFLRSQGELSSPIAQWDKLQWSHGERDAWGLIHDAEGGILDESEADCGGGLFAGPVAAAFDDDAAADELAEDFALEFMGGALDLDAEQLELDGIGGGQGEPRRASDPRQITLF